MCSRNWPTGAWTVGCNTCKTISFYGCFSQRFGVMKQSKFPCYGVCEVSVLPQ